MDICKVYKNDLKSKRIDDEFKQQLKHAIPNETWLFLDALTDDVVNVETNNNIKQSYNFKISWTWVFNLYIYSFICIVYANEV